MLAVEGPSEVARLEKVVGVGIEHIVEGILAVRPGLEEVGDVGLAAFARRSDQDDMRIGSCGESIAQIWER